MRNRFFIKYFIALLAGLLFGSGMIISAMVDPQKVLGFLSVSGEWDPSLLFVIGGALLVFTPIYHFFIKNRRQSINGEQFAWTLNNKIDRRLIMGSSIFGIGWGLAGFCPGPIISSLAGGDITVLAFMVTMIIGMLVANKYLSYR